MEVYNYESVCLNCRRSCWIHKMDSPIRLLVNWQNVPG